MPQKTKPDALDVFLQAYAFFQAQELIFGYGKKRNEVLHCLAIPALTLGAFASELFFKCLVLIETGNIPQGHNLKKFFDLLSPPSRKLLSELWERYASQRSSEWDQVERTTGRKVARDLSSSLSTGSRAFELLRYRYENAAPSDFQYYLDDLPHMLGHLILHMKPEWEVPAAKISVVQPSFSEDW